MLKESITYDDFNDETVTDVFYFNLTKAELLEMEVSNAGGLSSMLTRIMEQRDEKAIVETFKDLILRAYGEKSDDGKRFTKIDANGRRLADDFVQTAAYAHLFADLTTDADRATEWLGAVLPKDFVSAVEQAAVEASVVKMPPVPPAS